MLDQIYNEDCFETMENMPIGQCDVILTSPFYNTNKKAGKNHTLKNSKISNKNFPYVRYDKHVDCMSNDEYVEFTIRLFTEFDRILNMNGTILYNLSYGSQNTTGMFEAINGIVKNTNFTIADVIGWEKATALPNSCSKNKLTRKFEFVFVFCRKSEFQSFYCNKKIVSRRKTGQAMYENITNVIKAANNDGSCPYNKATFSSDLCMKLLKIYAPSGGGNIRPFYWKWNNSSCV